MRQGPVRSIPRSRQGDVIAARREMEDAAFTRDRMNVAAMVLFKNEELINALSALQVGKSIYEYVVYDSEVEREFAVKLDQRDDIRLSARANQPLRRILVWR